MTDTTHPSGLRSVVYTASWCGPCQRLKNRLTDRGITFARSTSRRTPKPPTGSPQANGGSRLVPTVRLPDGTRDGQPAPSTPSSSDWTSLTHSVARAPGSLAPTGVRRRAPAPEPAVDQPSRDRDQPGDSDLAGSYRRSQLVAREPSHLRELDAVRTGRGSRRPTADAAIISDEGKGHGWVASSCTCSTRTPASSATSRRTACSAVSPGSTNPASVENRPAGHACWRPNSARSSASVTKTITAGSTRGKCDEPSDGQWRSAPAALTSWGHHSGGSGCGWHATAPRQPHDRANRPRQRSQWRQLTQPLGVRDDRIDGDRTANRALSAASTPSR